MTKKKMHVDKDTDKNKSDFDNLFDELEKLEEEEKISNESNASDLLDDLELNKDKIVSDTDTELDELFNELENEPKSTSDSDLDDLFDEEEELEEEEVENEPKSTSDSDLDDLFDEEEELEEVEVENEPKSTNDSDLDDLFDEEEELEEVEEVENKPKSTNDSDSDLDDLFDEEEELEELEEVENKPKSTSDSDSDLDDLFDEEEELEEEIKNEPKSTSDSDLDDLFDEEELEEEVENEPKSNNDNDLDNLFEDEDEDEEEEIIKETEKNKNDSEKTPILVDKNVKDSKLEIKEKEKGKNSMGSLIDKLRSQTNKKSELKDEISDNSSTEDIEVQKLYGKKNNLNSSSTLKVSLISAAITLTLIAGSVFLLKDYIADYLVNENKQVIIASENKINAKVNLLEDELLAFNDKITKDVVNVEKAKELFNELNSSDSLVLQDLSSKFENQLNKIDLLQRNIESIRTENYGIEKNIENHNQLISDISKTIENQKEIMKKTVQIALDVIQQSRDLEKNIESNIYEKVMRNVKEEMSLQQSKLYDFSVIEDKLTTALNQNNELIKEVISIKKDNQNLQSQINSLKLNMTQNTDNNQSSVRENKVIDVLKSPSNTIEITKRNTEPKPVIPSDNFISYEIIAVLEDKFYIKHDGSDRFKIYKIGEILEGYGKILKIENQQIFAEKGIVRKK